MLRVIFYHYTCPVTTVCFDDGEPTVAPMLGLSLALGRREGNFVVAPRAELDDGLFDYVYGGAANRWDLLVFMAQMAAQRLRDDHPFVRMGRCRRATLHSETPLIVHLDGEFFCLPEDGVHDLEVELLPRRCASTEDCHRKSPVSRDAPAERFFVIQMRSAGASRLT